MDVSIYVGLFCASLVVSAGLVLAAGILFYKSQKGFLATANRASYKYNDALLKDFATYREELRIYDGITYLKKTNGLWEASFKGLIDSVKYAAPTRKEAFEGLISKAIATGCAYIKTKGKK